jgi:hypothetical protein
LWIPVGEAGEKVAEHGTETAGIRRQHARLVHSRRQLAGFEFDNPLKQVVPPKPVFKAGNITSIAPIARIAGR